jgi:hippurate hydrolase
MRFRILTSVGILLFVATLQAQTPDIKAQVPDLVEMYKGIHEHAELSHFEVKTSALVATELRQAGYTVTERVGVYPDGSKAYGVVGVLKNVAGPTLLIRADMDALPIVEETGVPYASHVRAHNQAGQEVGVMHACGHDIHTTVLVGTARALVAEKARWHGTLMLVGQPSEETADGARAMLADHLYERFGRPDMVIGLHDGTTTAAGTVGLRSGGAQAGATSVDVTIRGIGGHGAEPNAGRDPVVLAAMYIMAIQTIVSREEDPMMPSVVTVGTINGGTKRNIIPNEVKLELTTRTFSEKSRQVILDGLRQMAMGIATTAGLPPDKMPTVTVREDESTPIEYNDPALSARVKAALVATLGTWNVAENPLIMPSEDVGEFSLGNKIPLCYFSLGAGYPQLVAAANAGGPPVPNAHTSKFQPDPAPTIETGVTAMTAVAVSLLQ